MLVEPLNELGHPGIEKRKSLPVPEPYEVLPAGLDRSKMPKALAIIMDGNGRWARERSKPRVHGHRMGADSVRSITREAARLDIKELTFYAFSTENWSRPFYEVKLLMKLLKDYLVNERQEILENNIVFRAIGQLDRLPKDVYAEYAKTRELSAANTGMVMRLALSYGARHEIFEAAKAMAKFARHDPKAYATLAPNDFRRFLYDPEMLDPDLLIRTSNESRLSNFLLWHLSYSEIYITKTHWPDFREAALHQALHAYAKRERRYGGLLERSATQG